MSSSESRNDFKCEHSRPLSNAFDFAQLYEEKKSVRFATTPIHNKQKSLSRCEFLAKEDIADEARVVYALFHRTREERLRDEVVIEPRSCASYHHSALAREERQAEAEVWKRLLAQSQVNSMRIVDEMFPEMAGAFTSRL